MTRSTRSGSDLPKLSAPAGRALEGAGIRTLAQAARMSEAELSQLHGMGPSALGRLRQALKERGLSFRKVGRVPGLPPKLRGLLDDIRSTDRLRQGRAYRSLLSLTEAPVSWSYEAWDELVEGLRHEDNHVRSISAQLLANLARSDPKGRMLKDFGRLLQTTRDERFVTARHALQSIWRVGLGGRRQQALLLDGLETRFKDCGKEKAARLIRFDIIQGLQKLYAAVQDEAIRTRVLALIELEQDPGARRKYASVWRK